MKSIRTSLAVLIAASTLAATAPAAFAVEEAPAASEAVEDNSQGDSNAQGVTLNFMCPIVPKWCDKKK